MEHSLKYTVKNRVNLRVLLQSYPERGTYVILQISHFFQSVSSDSMLLRLSLLGKDTDY